ncbi:variant erythrocyte surface antigen-1 family protein [Babesia caballi]|uniref:Variant erythrocyte surface antigen-1 family protein n=1 Tax=Babesia caballi TaxID=5871 RepID=A0AAV4M0R1_BABCB|nr:variant erythrocyte surface antigen-1 family protein [Babesia caballi]
MHQEAIKALSNKVKELLKEVAKSDPNLGEDIKKIKDALSSDSGNNGLITKLAEGLQQFIGYNSSGKLTGGGILPANVAKHQVCNAVLNFVIRFLEGLCGIKASGHDKVSEVIRTLRKCVGTGQVPKGFKELVGKIEEKVKAIDTSLQNNRNKLDGAFQNFKTLVETLNYDQHGNVNVTQDSAKVRSFLDTVKNEIKQDGSNNFRNLCDKLKDLFGENKINMLWTSLSNNAQLNSSSLSNKTTSVTNYANDKGLTADINNLKYGMNAKPANAAVFTAVRDAATAFIAELQTKAYASYYDKAEWNNVSREDDKTKCAKIYLGCLLYYQALSYIYWGCHDNGGGWKDQTLAGGAMRFYFDSQGFLSPYVDRSKTGAHVAESALKGFSELQAAASSLSTTESPYASFTTKLHDNAKQKLSNAATECPLSALYHGASYYFRCQQITNAKSAVGAPKTIREMLYFIAALQFSPQYDAFDGYVTEYFKAVTGNQSGGNDDSELKLQVAVSGSSKTGETLSAADLKSYLTSTFHLAPAFIGLIQEPSTTGEPWLHSLFSNSQFNLSIPSSGAGIFGALSNYAYALQFQLSFLYIQCRNTYTVGCGWNQCTFGKTVNQNTTQSVESHICSVGCTKSTTDHKDGNHGTGPCQHAGCGSTKASPLQAFLTDKLRGFSRGHPSDPSSHLASCSGSLCHVPMGFNPYDLRAASNGNAQGGLNIAYALGSFCGGFNSPLRQLSEKLGCLTKRTPRTLGDMFGFTWHLKGQLFPKSQSTTQSWLNDLIRYTPFSSTVKDHLDVLKTLVGTGHTDSHGTADLTSLYSSGCNQQNQTCGPYLYPLTHSDGATFAPTHASAYLSWVLYLTDDLYESLQAFHERFSSLKCTGCKNDSKCASHNPGQHASQCQCPSIVQCADALTVFYEYGFHFQDAFWLKGWTYDKRQQRWNTSNANKRSCNAFHSQLQSVIAGNPLSSLLTSIDDFLFLFRYYFLGHLSGFWTIYICIIMYTFFFLLDTLHLRSHLKLTSSHKVPPLALLTSGTSLPITKLTYIGQ